MGGEATGSTRNRPPLRASRQANWTYLVERDSLLPHDPLDLGRSRLIETDPRVPCPDVVGLEVKV